MSEEKATVQMDVSKILASILVHLKEVSVPTDIFMSVNTDKQIEITYDDENKSFIFKLGDQIELTSNTRLEIWDATSWGKYLADREKTFADVSEEVLPGLF